MERNWFLRVALILGVLLRSVYQLVPSWFYFRLAPDKRNGPEYEQSVPRWAPDAKKHLNLGLDLQGGIHLAMGVDVDRAVKAKVARRADEIADFLKSKALSTARTRPAVMNRTDPAEYASSDAVRSTVLDAY